MKRPAKTKASVAPPPAVEPASAGRYTTIDDSGKVSSPMAALTRVSAARRQSKTAGLFSDGELGPANIADSNNIGYYNYQFPVDQMEMPSSRPEELEFWRIAYTRDPIVARGIDLHTELPLSKMKREKPKCSVESFSDYVFDYFERLINDTRLFSSIIQATREYHLIGEAYFFVEQPEHFSELSLCPATLSAIKQGSLWMRLRCMTTMRCISSRMWTPYGAAAWAALL